MRANVFQNAEQKQLYEKAAAEVKELEERLRGNDDDLLYAKSHIEGLQREIEDWHNRGLCVHASVRKWHTCSRGDTHIKRRMERISVRGGAGHSVMSACSFPDR